MDKHKNIQEIYSDIDISLETLMKRAQKLPRKLIEDIDHIFMSLESSPETFYERHGDNYHTALKCLENEIECFEHDTWVGCYVLYENNSMYVASRNYDHRVYVKNIQKNKKHTTGEKILDKIINEIKNKILFLGDIIND